MRGKTALNVDDTVARNERIFIAVKGPSHKADIFYTQGFGDGAVGGDMTLRYLLGKSVDFFEYTG